jgi:catalase-peroxidase
LLWPIKQQFGEGLSWGDLIVLAGTTAIEDMGGPVLGFCGGRVDDVNGHASELLGPSTEQEVLFPCPTPGNCSAPLGTAQIGLIYVNPEGPNGNPLPDETRHQIRSAFGRMGMNDSETVALIGGGHSFGKTHGACPNGAGPSPAQDPFNPWPGLCDNGTFTSGFEGPWTSNPLNFDSEYFSYLQSFTWRVHTGPGGHFQWETEEASPTAPAAFGDGQQNVMMMTSDVSLLYDPSYVQLVADYASDLPAFSDAFAHAWYKLMSHDMGPYTRCAGNLVPPPQPFQYPLPTPGEVVDFAKVRPHVEALLEANHTDVLPPDVTPEGRPYYGAALATLALQCAGTFRATDYHGGCNGARIRFAPENTWPQNARLDQALALLQPIKDQFGASLTWADLIVFAGHVAVEQVGPREVLCGRCAWCCASAGDWCVAGAVLPRPH